MPDKRKFTFLFFDTFRRISRQLFPSGGGVPGVVVAVQIKYYLVSSAILLPYALTPALSQPFDMVGNKDNIFGIAPEIDNIYGLSVEELPI